MKKHYESSSNPNVEAALRRQYMGGGGNQLFEAVRLAKNECDTWFSPQALRTWARHTLASEELGDTPDAIKYRNEHSFDLHQEAEALAFSEGLRTWAERDAPTVAAVDVRAVRNREEAIRARARELRAEAERALEEHYIEVATTEYDVAHSTRPAAETSRSSRRGKGAHS